MKKKILKGINSKKDMEKNAFGAKKKKMSLFNGSILFWNHLVQSPHVHIGTHKSPQQPPFLA